MDRRNRKAPASADDASGQRADVPSTDTTRIQLLGEAARLFRQQGVVATTMRQIADAMRMKAGSIYYYFDSKDEILDEVLDLGMQAVFNAVRHDVERLPSETSSRRKIETAIAAHLRTLLRYGDFTSANIRIFSQVPERAKKRHLPLRQAYTDYWSRLFEEAQARGEVRSDINIKLLRLFLIGSLNWSLEWFNPKRGAVDDLARDIATMVFDGIAPRSATQTASRNDR